VGAWCFAYHMGPELVTETRGLDIGPHPHTELHTVTWLVAGEVLHRDSLGSEQVIRAGQAKLMTAGEGVTDSEEAIGRYRGQLHGVQLWMAQPITWARAATRWCCRRPNRPGCYCSAGALR
jgi:redox-sensitive bicupin YhaK (pirin superfamily)